MTVKADFAALVNALGLERSGQLVAIVGGGGKSSLMFSLAQALSGRVITTTTTRIFAVQMNRAPVVCNYPSQDMASCLEAGLEQFGHCLLVGAIQGDKATGIPVDLPGRLLAQGGVEYVLVEADGSRMKPVKAPAEDEPVIPPDANLVIPVAGIEAVGGRLGDIAHRPERVAQLTGLGLNEPLTVTALATLLSHPDAGLKNVPAGARVIPLINKVESAAQLSAARQVARQVLAQEQVDRVIIAAIHGRQPLREAHRRVTAVVLAAGESDRMGQTKQLLPWGDTTILGQVLANIQASAVNEIVVVSGHDQQAVAQIAAEVGTSTVYNPDYQAGEMLSSLQVAVGQLPPNREAVLVMLADQPLVGPEIIDRLLEEYWRGGGELIAPTFQGRRGNPVLIGRPYFNELLALSSGEAPRTLIKSHAQDLKVVPVDTPGILQDMDTLGEYERWRPR